MVTFCIRKYEHRDYEAVRHVFTLVRPEVVPATFVHVLKRPQTHLNLFGLFSLLFILLKSILVSVSLVVLALYSYRLLLTLLIRQYIQQSLQADLLDIHASYIQTKGACFWVAEVGGKVCGIIGACPMETSDGRPRLVLKRLAVLKIYRGCGIGKALCRAVIDFASKQEYKEITLNSAMVYHAAHKLFEGLRFNKVSEHKRLTLFGRLTNFVMLQYRYDVHV